MFNKILITIACFVLTFPAYGNVFEHPQSLETIAGQIPVLNSTECKFRQEKTIPASNVVLKSSGDFKYEKDKGVTFYTTYPIKSTVSYTSKEYKQINNVINAISNKAYAKLEKDFQFYYINQTLGLIPKKESPAFNYLKSIEIEFSQTAITKMIILAADSTKTVIWFQ